MDLRLQTKLLQVLQDGEIQPLGSNRTIKVNVRVMAATHRDLTRGIQEGTFREDLYYRLKRSQNSDPASARASGRDPAAGGVAPGPAPSIRTAAARSQRKAEGFSLRVSLAGNVRELENVMRRYLVYQDATILIRELMESAGHLRPGISLAAVASFPASSNENSASSSKKTGGRLAGVDSAKGASSGGNSEAETHAGNNQPGSWREESYPLARRATLRRQTDSTGWLKLPVWPKLKCCLTLLKPIAGTVDRQLPHFKSNTRLSCISCKSMALSSQKLSAAK